MWLSSWKFVWKPEDCVAADYRLMISSHNKCGCTLQSNQIQFATSNCHILWKKNHIFSGLHSRVQCLGSSEESGQSVLPLQYWSKSMHFPESHLNWWILQLVIESAGLAHPSHNNKYFQISKKVTAGKGSRFRILKVESLSFTSEQSLDPSRRVK